MLQIKSGVHESSRILLIRAKAFRLEKRIGDLPANDGRHNIISKVPVSTDIFRRFRSLFKGHQHLHGAPARSFHTAP